MDVIEAIGNTPLIELKRVSAGLPVKVYIKCEHLNPGGSVKDRTARAIILDAEQRGQLGPGATIIEGTAGNTGVGLALLASQVEDGAEVTVDIRGRGEVFTVTKPPFVTPGVREG